MTSKLEVIFFIFFTCNIDFTGVQYHLRVYINMKEVTKMLFNLISSDVESMTYVTLLVLALILVFGMYAGRLFEKIKIPCGASISLTRCRILT